MKCIEEGWHLEKKLELPPEPAPEPSDFEKNKATAKEAMQEFEGLVGSEIFLRSDFLEVKLRDQRCQIFYAESSKFFSSNLNFAMEELRKV